MLANSQSAKHLCTVRSVCRGFTLIELLVVVAMIAVLLSLAAPSYSTLRTNQKLAAASDELYASLLQARNEALSLNRRVTVEPLASADWKSGWRIYVDLNNNGSFDAGSDRLILETATVSSAFTLTGQGGGAAPTSFSFDPRGFLRGNAASRVIFSSTETARQKHVIVFSTGRARLCDPKLAPSCTDS